MVGRVLADDAELSARDRRVLAETARVRLLTARQIEQLCFSNGTALSRARRCRRCLERLTRLGYLTRLDRRIGGSRAGSAGYVYGLSGHGQRVVGTHGPAGGVRRRRQWEPRALFLNHLLAVSSLYVELRTLAAQASIDVTEFEAEPGCWRTFTSLMGQDIILKPDAFTVLLTADEELHWFVEVDNGTESLPTVRRKLDLYWDYYSSGNEQRLSGIFPRVLYVASTPHRAAALLGLLRQLPAERWTLFQVVEAQHRLAALTGSSP
ncbi:MAG: hypothetical protein JWL72_1187 [Ilumatobacteraceae bacterium]|nr:hypothetical protein [Ilumatobacteraceae bacterium]